jgi:hypothetical protein
LPSRHPRGSQVGDGLGLGLGVGDTVARGCQNGGHPVWFGDGLGDGVALGDGDVESWTAAAASAAAAACVLGAGFAA